MIHRKNIKI